MKIEHATLVPGTETPTGDGYTQATRCVIRMEDGTRRAAVLKKLPQQSVLAEAFSALLLRAWGLNVPEPFLIDGGDKKFHFASADASYPSLKQRFGIGELEEGPIKNALTTAACFIVAGLPQTPLALAADEAIDNRDRNLGNVLWDGAQEAWIDHELALGLADHLVDGNKLAQMVNHTENGESIKKSSLAAWIVMDRNAANEASIAADAPHLAELESKRLSILGNRLLSRFPTPNDLLSDS
jgi:hypothetical protein